jgi:hypothetical protein
MIITSKELDRRQINQCKDNNLDWLS